MDFNFGGIMFRSFVVLSALLLGQMALANTPCISSGGEGATPATHLLVRFDNALVGELDPTGEVGEGALMVFTDPFANKKLVVHEDNRYAPYGRQLISHANQGLMVSIRKACLKPEGSQEHIRRVGIIVRPFLKNAQSVSYYDLVQAH